MSDSRQLSADQANALERAFAVTHRADKRDIAALADLPGQPAPYLVLLGLSRMRASDWAELDRMTRALEGGADG